VQRSRDSSKSPRPKRARARKPAEPERAYDPSAEMADIMCRATEKQYYLVTPEEMDGLRMEEIRQPHLARLQQQWLWQHAPSPAVADVTDLPDKGGAPSKLPEAAEAEIRDRIAKGETKIAPEMVNIPRSWVYAPGKVTSAACGVK
jgi:hypothetical protein